MTVSLGKNRNTVLVPNFISMEWDTAKAMADGMGLVLAKNEVDDNSKAGTVLKQDIKVGEEVPEDTVIELTVSNGEKKSVPVRVVFNIPANTSGLFHIELYEGGVEVVRGGSFNPEYAAGTTSLEVTGKDSTDMLAVLVNDATNARANIGQYHIDFNTQSSQQMSGDIGDAFKQVTGAAAATPATTTAAAPPATTTPAPAPVVTDAPPQPQETQAPAAPNGSRC